MELDYTWPSTGNTCILVGAWIAQISQSYHSPSYGHITMTLLTLSPLGCLLMRTIWPCHGHTYREKMFSRWQLCCPLYTSFWSTSSTSCQELCSCDCSWHQPWSAQLFSWDLRLRVTGDPTASPIYTLSLSALLKSFPQDIHLSPAHCTQCPVSPSSVIGTTVAPVKWDKKFES